MDKKAPEVPLSQIIKDREVTMDKTEDNIEYLTAEKEYKENQLKTEITEENISELYNLVSHPIDHKKPRHVLEIEVGMIKKILDAKEKSLKVMKELQVEDKKKCHQD